MQGDQQLTFGAFTLDKENAQLWRGKRELKARSKTFEVLRYLVERPRQLVTKEALLDAVWPEVVVSEAVLAGCIRELRKTLRDDPKVPQYIETVYKRGYRFIAPVVSSQHPVVRGKEGVRDWRPGTGPTSSQASTIVGRETELDQLDEWFNRASHGHRQVLFVTGEAGIGKTTLVEEFLARITPKEQFSIGRGQCIEQYGAGEAYLPVLDALSRLCREEGGKRVIKLLERHAPTWLAQMPTLLSAAKFKTLQQKTQGATKERMLRELAEALEAITRERPVVFVLEDLHWSDTATIELLNFLARRPESARLLILGTYRPVEVIVREHPLKEVKQELQLHQQCEEFPLKFLNVEAVREYLRFRFPHTELPDSLASVIHERTDGNPLFMVVVIDDLAREGMLEEKADHAIDQTVIEQIAVRIPRNIRQLIDNQYGRLTVMEQQIVEVGSVAGMEFSAAAIATGVAYPVDAVEDCCERLAQRGQLLQAVGASEWPDGTVATRYGFLHALYQEIVYERVTAARRTRLHRQIGEREEAA